jgi:ribosomal protein S6--L-glutamate ligase
MKELIILSGRPDLYSTKRLQEEGISYGFNTEIVDYRKIALGISTTGDSKIIYDGRVLNPCVVIPRIGSRSTRYGAAVVRQFIGSKVKSTISPGGILRARDKLGTMQALSASGVPIPLSSAARTPSGISEVINLVNGVPVVVKLVEGTHGDGVVLAETKKAAESLLSAFHQLDADFLVQSFIKDANNEDIRAIVVDNKVVAAMKRKASPDEFRANLHKGGSAEPVKLDRMEKRAVLLAAKSLGVNVAGVDFLRTPNGPLVIEVNISPGLQGIEQTTKINVAGSIIKYAGKLCGINL